MKQQLQRALAHALAVIVVVVAVACGDNGPCADGSVDAIVVGPDAYTIEGFDQGFLAGGRSDDQVFPYADGSPFLTCRSVGSLVVRERIGEIDGERDFPALEELGSIFVDFDDEGSTRAVPLISGFDSVLQLGSISGVLGLQDGGSVEEISGFNRVKTIGTFNVTADVTGFRALEFVEGDLDVGDISGPTGLRSVRGTMRLDGRFSGEFTLNALEEVGGDLIVDRTRLTSLSFPALGRVGGEYLIDSNIFLARWAGASRGATIGGDFTAQGNNPANNALFNAWLEGERITVDGRIKICLNGSAEEREGDTCNE